MPKVSYGLARSVLLLSIPLQSLLCLSQLIGIGSAQRCVPREGDAVYICPGTTVLIVFTNRVSSRDGKSSDAQLEVVSNVKVGGYVVIAKGAIVQRSVARESAHMFADPGSLAVDVLGVPTVTGQTVALVGTARASGTLSPGCMDLACYFLPPTQAKIKPGTLIPALVEKTAQLDHTALMELNKKGQNSTQNLARVYLYSMEVEYGFLPPRVQIDGKSAGRFGPYQYACVSLAPGTHSLRTGHTGLNVALAAGQEYFVRLEGHQASGLSLEVTDSLESEPQLLTPAHIDKSIADNCLR